VVQRSGRTFLGGGSVGSNRGFETAVRRKSLERRDPSSRGRPNPGIPARWRRRGLACRSPPNSFASRNQKIFFFGGFFFLTPGRDVRLVYARRWRYHPLELFFWRSLLISSTSSAYGRLVALMDLASQPEPVTFKARNGQKN
jgi:hypothetical protein